MPKEILTEDEVKCSLLASPFYRTRQPIAFRMHINKKCRR